jgi:FKBP-type peptidyl-prolyl cis-trans isomerase FklB
MTLPARHRGRMTLALGLAAAAALLAGSLPATAQQPSAPAAATPAAKKAPAKPAAAQGEVSEKSARSYSLGLLWGEQLRNSGVPADAISETRIAAGVHDAISGKVAMTDKDRENLRALATTGSDSNHRAADTFLAANGKKPGVVTTASGLQYQELKAGSGESPKPTDSVVVNYRGMLLNGTEFDASSKHGGSATFQVDQVIPGWTEALQLMKPGAKWRVFVPPRLAYDLRPPTPAIPAGSMLVFDVELLSVKAAPAAPAAAANPAPAQPTPK